MSAPRESDLLELAAFHRELGDREVTVRLVRHPDGTTSLVRIPTALPWVLRWRYLVAADLD